MSLIYQALQQTQQQVAGAHAVGAAQQPLARPATSQGQRLPVAVPRGTIAQGLLLAALGALLGAGLSQWLAPDKAAAPLADTPSTAPTASPVPPLADLPRATPPRPMAAMPLQNSYVLHFASGAAARPAPAKPRSAPPAPRANTAMAADVLEQQALLSAASAASATSADQAPVPVPQIPPEAMPTSSGAIADLFEGLNRALATGQQQVARQHLTDIQSRLPAASVARLRAEAWYAHQSADTDSAAQIYRQLLQKLPGDEHAAVNLASIEKRRGHPERARQVLAGALRHHPLSPALREALAELSLERSSS